MEDGLKEWGFIEGAGRVEANKEAIWGHGAIK